MFIWNIFKALIKLIIALDRLLLASVSYRLIASCWPRHGHIDFTRAPSKKIRYSNFCTYVKLLLAPLWRLYMKKRSVVVWFQDLEITVDFNLQSKVLTSVVFYLNFRFVDLVSISRTSGYHKWMVKVKILIFLEKILLKANIWIIWLCNYGSFKDFLRYDL